MSRRRVSADAGDVTLSRLRRRVDVLTASVAILCVATIVNAVHLVLLGSR